MAVTTPAVTLAEGVRAVLTAATGTELAGAEVRRLTGGASRETYAVRATDPAGRETTAVLRRDPPGRGEAERMRAEAACLRAAAPARGPGARGGAPRGAPPPIDGPDLPLLDPPRIGTEQLDGVVTQRMHLIGALAHRLLGLPRCRR
ncbi:phosphotransferase, partial [Nocardia carnea]|uniref:phosphotransferase n=1 Tax=Nocardia carnea TaxID=37328 RepID=UPI0024587D7C